MATIYDVDSAELVEKTAEELKKIEHITPPKWAMFVKTGNNKARPPVKSDWWYIRSASILRKVHLLGPIGVSKLRTKYGGKKDRGYKKEHFFKASGNIIRKILQQLQKAELIKSVEKDIHKGRIIAPKGIALLDRIATEIYTRTTANIPKVQAVITEKPAKKVTAPRAKKVKNG